MNKLAILFSGQGSQYVGMGKELIEQSITAREMFEEANDILGIDLIRACLEGNAEELNRTELTQPAILTVSIAMYRLFSERYGIEPSYLAGHSLGEFSALVCADSLSFASAVKLVHLRGKLMQEAVPLGIGSMSAIRSIDEHLIEQECVHASKSNKQVSIACYNAPRDFVISGHQQAVLEVSRRLQSTQAAQVIQLDVSAPFHTEMMRAAANQLESELAKYTFKECKWPVISNVTGLPYSQGNEIKPNIVKQMTHPVQWRDTMSFLHDQGVNICIELGPKKVLRHLAKKNIPQINALSFDDRDDLVKFKKLYPSFIDRCVAIAICTKNRNNDPDEFREEFIKPFLNLKTLQEELELSKKYPTTEQVKQSISLMKMMFQAKKTPLSDERKRWYQIQAETGVNVKNWISN